LTADQLHRKRAYDRDAQHAYRERNKERIEKLEGEVRRLREENQELYFENRWLRGQIAHEESSTSHMLPPQQNQLSLTENSSCRSVPELGGISGVIALTPLPADQIYPQHLTWIDDRRYHAMRNPATVCYAGTTDAPIILTQATPEAPGMGMVDPNILRSSSTAASIDVWPDSHIAACREPKLFCSANQNLPAEVHAFKMPKENRTQAI
jgi:hypothetical protein